MAKPGHSPATYDPSPHQISALASTDLYVRIGVPFEDAWLNRLRSANPGMQILDARAGIGLRPIAHAHPAGDGGHDRKTSGKGTHHAATEIDPHIWTSPPLVKLMARNIRDALTELDPTNGADYARNFDVFAAELDALDRQIRTLLEGIEHRKFMVFHPAWGYFAETYSLEQVPIEKGGKEPGARTPADLIERAKRESIKVIFVQPQFDDKLAKQVAEAIGGRTLSIDPLSADYIGNLRAVARKIAEAMKQ
jgi:zinc transport system substrate-binding protein